jgi:hypothetical protein
MDCQSLDARFATTVRGGRTDGSRLDHVADGEPLDCLILGGASRAVGATDRLDVAAALLVATAAYPLALPSLSRWCVHAAYLEARFLTILADSAR